VIPLLSKVGGHTRRTLEQVDASEDENMPPQRPQGGASRIKIIAVDAPPLSSSDEEAENDTDGSSNGCSRRGNIGRTSFGTTHRPAANTKQNSSLSLELDSSSSEKNHRKPRVTGRRNTTAPSNKRGRDVAGDETERSGTTKKAKPSEIHALENFGDHIVNDPFQRNSRNQKPRVGYGRRDREQAKQKAASVTQGSYLHPLASTGNLG